MDENWSSGWTKKDERVGMDLEDYVILLPPATPVQPRLLNEMVLWEDLFAGTFYSPWIFHFLVFLSFPPLLECLNFQITSISNAVEVTMFLKE